MMEYEMKMAQIRKNNDIKMEMAREKERNRQMELEFKK